jgi:two-component system CheB/CheR fusion protein
MAKRKAGKKRVTRAKRAVKAPQSKDEIATAAVEEPSDAWDELPAIGFPLVAIGASAGGLDPLGQLLAALPAQPGFAVVIVQHLAPRHPSILPDLLASQSSMPVQQVTDRVPIDCDHVYVIPPGMQMTVVEGHLRLAPRIHDESEYTPIDTFFLSVAEYARSRAIGVILSGTASDGAAGLRAIKAAGGITLVQDPADARFDSMPRAALATECVDMVLRPFEIAAELVRIARHPYVGPSRAAGRSDVFALNEEQLRRIFHLLRNASGVDFTHYKLPTIKRRLHRRMVLHKISTAEHYLRYLDENKDEIQALYKDILIHVTRFFREPESFETLQAYVFPRITDDRKSDNPIRIWAPGCSTGEEPYSVAIALLEFLGDKAPSTSIQVFATDLSEGAIEKARAGVYPESIANDVSPERLRRFFTCADGNYQITKTVRDLCVFARQDLTRDPPFSKLDLIVCRNVLIYLGQVLQKKLMTVFHYALKSEGFLVLGHAETVGTHADLFGVADKRHRVFTKKAVVTPAREVFPLEYKVPRIELGRKPLPEIRGDLAIHREATRLLLDRYTPPGVIVDASLQIIQFRGQTGPFLEPAPGEASLNLMKMAREGIVYGLRTAIRAARKENAPVRRDGMRVKYNGHAMVVDLEVVPLGAGGEDRCFLILFHAQKPSKKPVKGARSGTDGRAKSTDGAREQELEQLQQELAANRDYLQSIIQDLEAANEELQSANEEILSSNEELQSTNEELDTAKEELQSTNEELNTLNEELHGRNEELGRVNSDLLNLLGSVQIAIVIVSNDLRIRRFTPMAEKVLNLIPSDVGRPITHIKPNIEFPDLEQLIGEVIQTMNIADREVRDASGHWYLLRVRPYKDVDNRIEGAVLALFDIQASKQHDEQVTDIRAYASEMLEAVEQPMLVLNADLDVYAFNSAFRNRFELDDDQPSGQSIHNFQKGHWSVPELRRLLNTTLSRPNQTHRAELPAADGRAKYMIHARRFRSGQDQSGLVLLAFSD